MNKIAIDLTDLDYKPIGLGAISTTLYGILGGFPKITSIIDESTGETIKGKFTIGEIASGLTALGIGATTAGLCYLVKYCHNQSKKSKKNPNDKNTPWLFERLK